MIRAKQRSLAAHCEPHMQKDRGPLDRHISRLEGTFINDRSTTGDADELPGIP